KWIFGAHSPVLGFPPSSSVEFVPVLPAVCTAAVPPHGKGWLDKRMPSCKIYLSDAFALDSSWPQPEEPRLLQGAEKPVLLSSPGARAVARPAAASRALPTLLLAPQLIPGGAQSSLKAVGGTQSLALLSLEPEPPQGPPGPTLQPCHLLTLSPLKAPLLASPFPGCASRLEPALGPVVPAQLARVTALGTPAVTLLASSLVEPARADRGRDPSRASCPPTLILHTERRSVPPRDRDQDHPFKLVSQAESPSSGNRPVASTPVPGSPWCVVWTGDDRVFFFNPSLQLSVWERPLALRHRGDLARLLQDPPHKRKLEPAPADKCVSSCPGDENDDLSIKTKRNKTEEHQAAEEEQGGEEGSASRASPPLEERITHFRDMLLERGVSAFSTWEKELHKMVFDPRYLLLNPEERRQIFEQFVKTRVREEYKERKNKLLLAKEEFKKLLEESKLSPRTTFKEFAEKHGRDQRFRLVQKKKDQEHFFNQFILILKKRDKENRLRLRKMR
ncbi:TCRGL protein, partial [Aegithalos caudatus]|nr:TCRGL protein [Aegithalos caudatus]